MTVRLFILLALLFWHGAAHAAEKGGIGTTAPPGCLITSLTPSETKTLSAKQLNQLTIVSAASYYTAPCWRATVDFLVAPLDPTFNSTYQNFYFDSITNELIDTKGKCNTYHQTTAIWKESNGKWTSKGYGRLRGSWSGSKCSFKPPVGQSDFRQKKYSPTSQQTHYRVVSVATTGKGIVLPAPPMTQNIFQQTGLATARSVCFAVEHAHDDNTPVIGCADPTR